MGLGLRLTVLYRNRSVEWVRCMLPCRVYCRAPVCFRTDFSLPRITAVAMNAATKPTAREISRLWAHGKGNR